MTDSDEGFRLESNRRVTRNLSGSGQGKPGRAGRGRDSGFSSRAREPVFSGIEWAQEHLPDENLGFASTAANLEFMQRPPRDRRAPTRDEVLDRLRRSGRDSVTLEGKARAQDILKDVAK